MKSTYEPLGKYIRLVDERNVNLVTDTVLGINIDKYFMPSVANVIGTDLSRYKLLRNGRFACNPMHVGRDGRLPVARFTDDSLAIVSPAYFMFEIIDEAIIEPEYLMLCFRHPDFDRMCWFRTDASVRGGITWEDVCALTIPVISIDEQRRIAYDYKVITNRIELLNKLNKNLSAQAQSILVNYMEKYEYSLLPLSSIANIIDCLHTEKPKRIDNGMYQLIQLDNIRDDGFLDLEAITYMISKSDYENWTRKCEIIENDCVITNVGRMGAVSQAPKGTHAAMGRNMTCIRLKQSIDLPAYLITLLLSQHMKLQMHDKKDVGTIMEALNVKNIPKLLCPIFDDEIMLDLENRLSPIVNNIEFRNIENQKLEKLRRLLLDKLSGCYVSKGV